MKYIFLKSICLIFFGIAILLLSMPTYSQQNSGTWKAGIKKVEITPHGRIGNCRFVGFQEIFI